MSQIELARGAIKSMQVVNRMYMFYRLHDRMPVILPDKESEEVWLQNGALDMKYAP